MASWKINLIQFLKIGCYLYMLHFASLDAREEIDSTLWTGSPPNRVMPIATPPYWNISWKMSLKCFEIKNNIFIVYPAVIYPPADFIPESVPDLIIILLRSTEIVIDFQLHGKAKFSVTIFNP
jgi:hypothetical protein